MRIEPNVLIRISVLLHFQFIVPVLLSAGESIQSRWDVDLHRPGEGQYSIPAHGKLILHIPDSWRSKLIPGRHGSLEVIAFAPKTGSSFKMFIDPLLSARETSDFLNSDAARYQVKEMAESIGRTALESNILLHELPGSDAPGYYFTFTYGTKAKIFEWQCVTRGRIRVGAFYVQFTILTDSPKTPEIGTGLRMIAGAVYDKYE